MTDAQSFWQAYLNTFDDPRDPMRHNPQPPPEAWGFGDSPQMADDLGALVASGVKRATCGALWEYEFENEPLPQVGDLSIVLDGAKRPLCIIKITEVTIRPFNEVDAQFAYDEGEGDRTLEDWRRGHERFFTRSLADINREFGETMPLVCERFRVVYPTEE